MVTRGVPAARCFQNDNLAFGQPGCARCEERTTERIHRGAHVGAPRLLDGGGDLGLIETQFLGDRRDERLLLLLAGRRALLVGKAIVHAHHLQQQSGSGDLQGLIRIRLACFGFDKLFEEFCDTGNHG